MHNSASQHLNIHREQFFFTVLFASWRDEAAVEVIISWVGQQLIFNQDIYEGGGGVIVYAPGVPGV